MSFNLLDTVKGYIGNELVSKAAGHLGESESGISKALGGILPSILGGVVSKATSGGEGASGILDMAKGALGSGLLGNLGSFFGGGDSILSKGAGLLSGLFGDKAGGITNAISSFAGIKESSASHLMSMAAPAALGAIGQHASDNNLDAGGLSSMLASQKDNIMSALPSGLSGIMSMLGGGGVAAAATKVMSSATHETTERAGAAANYATETASGGGSPLKWLLPIALLGLLAWGAYKLFSGGKADGGDTHTDSAAHATVTTDTNHASTDTSHATTTVVPGGKESMKVKLADGTEISAFKGGVEDRLVAFVSDPNSVLDTAKGNWFDFDNLNFELGKSVIAKESMGQVQNLAAILKAYPKMQIKIGGYTDKKGNPAGNLKLSQSRADAVVAALKSLGANAAQIVSAKGYGSEFATVDASASDEERRKDRRTAVNVKAK
jgi:outer membrane protein OmpA-like peptidoglycan-associated protein